MAALYRLETALQHFANNQEAKWVKRRKLYNLHMASFQLALKSEGLLWSAGSDALYGPNTPTLTTELESEWN